MGVEQRGELGRMFGAVAYPADEQHVDGCGAVQRHTQRHAGRLGLREVDHPAHARVDRGGVVGDRHRGVDVRRHRQIGPHVGAGDRGEDLPAAVGRRGPARRQQPRHRDPLRATRRAGVGELRCAGRRSLGDVGRRGRARDPGRPAGVVAIGQLLPRLPQGGVVDAGLPLGLPVTAAGVGLVCGERGVVRIDVDLVRVDAHPQLDSAVGPVEEPGLEAHRQQRERHGGRSARRAERRRGDVERIGEQRAEVGHRQRHGASRSRTELGMVMRTGVCRNRAATRAECWSVVTAR